MSVSYSAELVEKDFINQELCKLFFVRTGLNSVIEVDELSHQKLTHTMTTYR